MLWVVAVVVEDVLDLRVAVASSTLESSRSSFLPVSKLLLSKSVFCVNQSIKPAINNEGKAATVGATLV
jgi:hypothetical protein